MDFENLPRRYLSYVLETEGSAFLPSERAGFSADEIAWLELEGDAAHVSRAERNHRWPRKGGVPSPLGEMLRDSLASERVVASVTNNNSLLSHLKARVRVS